MKFCPSCGKPYEEGVRFCDGCGATLSTQTPPHSAPQSRPVVDDDDEKTVFLGDIQAQAPVEPPAQAPVQDPFTVGTTPVAQQAAPKKKKTGLIVIIIVAVLAIIGIICAVAFGGSEDSKSSSDSDSDKSTTQSETESGTDNSSDEVSGDSSGEVPGGSSGDSSDSSSGDISQATDGTTKLQNDELSYVMIYNPAIYDERNSYDDSYRQTGDFSASQIDIDTGRGDSLDSPTSMYFTISQDDFLKDFPEKDIETDISRSELPGTNYSLGDKKTFYHATSTNTNTRTEGEFECVYAGEYCYIWVLDSSDAENIEEYGKEFDENIYEQCVDMFGEPRFVGDSGKVNIFIYELENGLLGFFHPYEVYSRSELSADDIEFLEENKMNMDHAIIHINSRYTADSSLFNMMCGTISHEFQHLIYGCNTIDAVPAVWLNESMSGYIEEQLYSGGKKEAGHFESLERSSLIRNGQSLYNFNTGSSDIGVYGSVYYFTEYMKILTGSDEVFSNIHSYWEGLSEGTEAEALYESVKASTISEIDGLIEYPSSVNFSSTEEEWMSKLTLDFYLNILSNDMNIPNHSEFDISGLLYDDLSGASIEGGGRIILSVKDGEFDIPSDAENGLIYIGLDSDFNVVTDYIYK